MTENRKKERSRQSQITLILRLAAGIYLVWLAKDLVINVGEYSGGRQLIQAVCAAVFTITGLFFAAWSLKKLICREYLRPGEEQETE